MGRFFVIATSLALFFSWNFTTNFVPSKIPIEIFNMPAVFIDEGLYQDYFNSIKLDKTLFTLGAISFIFSLAMSASVFNKLIKGDYLRDKSKGGRFQIQSLLLAAFVLFYITAPTAYLLSERDPLATTFLSLSIPFFATLIINEFISFNLRDIYPGVIFIVPTFILIFSLIIPSVTPRAQPRYPMPPNPTQAVMTATAVAQLQVIQLTQVSITTPMPQPVSPSEHHERSEQSFNILLPLVLLLRDPAFQGIGTLISIILVFVGWFREDASQRI